MKTYDPDAMPGLAPGGHPAVPTDATAPVADAPVPALRPTAERSDPPTLPPVSGETE